MGNFQDIKKGDRVFTVRVLGMSGYSKGPYTMAEWTAHEVELVTPKYFTVNGTRYTRETPRAAVGGTFYRPGQQLELCGLSLVVPDEPSDPAIVELFKQQLRTFQAAPTLINLRYKLEQLQDIKLAAKYAEAFLALERDLDETICAV